jgi:DNA-binding NarL/FixJ family response regulator
MSRTSCSDSPTETRANLVYTARVRTFLVVDDSANKAQYLMGLVDRALPEVRLVGATTTDEAKAVIDARQDIFGAFIDYEIPTENGPAVIAYLRKKFPSCRIACVTGGGESYRRSAMDAGADAFITTSLPGDTVEGNLLALLEMWIC